MIDVKRSSYFGIGDGAQSDRIEPVAIRHFFDEIFTNGRLDQTYNYLAYVFERGAMRCWARHYLDEAGKITLYREARPADVSAQDWDTFFDDVEAFLSRRFGRVTQR